LQETAKILECQKQDFNYRVYIKLKNAPDTQSSSVGISVRRLRGATLYPKFAITQSPDEFWIKGCEAYHGLKRSKTLKTATWEISK
jgi:hypothetical protein